MRRAKFSGGLVGEESMLRSPTVPPDTQSRYFRPFGLFVSPSCFDNQAESVVSIRKCLLILSPTPASPSWRKQGGRAPGSPAAATGKASPWSHRAGSRREDRRAKTFPIGLLCNGLGACPPTARADWPAAPMRRNKLDQQLCFFMIIRTSHSCCSVRPPSILLRFLFLYSVDSALAADRSGHHWASLTILYLIASHFPTLSSLRELPPDSSNPAHAAHNGIPCPSKLPAALCSPHPSRPRHLVHRVSAGGGKALLPR